MSCKYCVPNIIRVNSITSSSGALILTSSTTPTLINSYRYILIIPESLIPAMTTIDQVFVSINDVAIPLTDRCLGNNVYSDQLASVDTNQCGNKVLRLVYGSNASHFKIISQCLQKTSVIV